MEEQEVYMTPEVKVIELELEGVIACSGEQDGFGGRGDQWGGEYGW